MNLMLPLIESFGISDIGTTRTNNEDIWAELPDDHFYILAMAWAATSAVKSLPKNRSSMSAMP